MSDEENPLPVAVKTIPLVEEVNAKTAVVAASIHNLSLNIDASSGDVKELLRVVFPAGHRSSEAVDDDPLAPEIDANVGLIKRHLFSEALEGFHLLQQKCGSKPNLSRSRFRIANNTGVCLLGLGRFSEAQAEFNKALSIEPNDDLARSNLATAHLHADEPARTLDLLRKPVTNLSVKGQAGALRIAALFRLGRHEDIEAFLREEAWTAYDAHVQFAVAQVRIAKGDTDGVDEALRVATTNAETAREAHVLNGMRELGIAGAVVGGAGFVSIDKELPQARLEAALAHFERALESCPLGLHDVRAELLAHCGLVLSLLGNSEQALRKFEASRSINSRFSVSAVVNHAAVLMERDEFAAATRIIRDSGLADQHPHVRLQLAEALHAAHADAEVIDLLANTWQTFQDERHRIHGAAMVLNSCRRLQRLELGKKTVDTLIREDSGSWNAWLHLGRHFAISGDRTQAMSSFKKALSLTDSVGSQQVREELGYRQALWGNYADCIATLEPLDSTTLNDEATQALAVSLFNTGALKRAHTITNGFLAREHVPVQIIEMAVALASIAGDIDRATEFQRRLLLNRRSHLCDINCLATLLLRQGKREQAAETLSVEASEMEGGQDAHSLMTFAHLLSEVQDRRALTYGYRAWERGRDQAQIQQGYIGLFLRRERDEADGLKVDAVSPGTTVTLSVVGKGTSREVSIVRDEDLIPDAATWVKASDPWATRLIGKRVGDEVSGASSPLMQTNYRIDNIKSNYVRAFQETMSGFNDRFPDATGLWKVEVPYNDPAGITKTILAFQGDSARIKEFVAMYAQWKLPLAALASALHRPVPVVWSGLIADEDGICFSLGAEQELNVAARVIGRRTAPLYLDYSALMTLVLLDDGLREKLVQLVGHARVMQSLLDDLHTHAARAMVKGTGEGMYVSVGEDGRLKIAPLGDLHGFLARVQKTAREVASPWPAYSRFEPSPPEWQNVIEMLGEPTSDLLAEAAATDGIVLCDDHALGVLARAKNQTCTVSIQAVALAAYREGRLALPEYASIVERLAVAKYSFLSVNHDIIEVVLKRHQWQVTSEVAAVFSCLEGPRCTTESAGVVGAKALRAIILEPSATPHRDVIIDALLSRLTRGHDVQQVTDLMVHILRRLLPLASIHLDWLVRTIRAWTAARS
ncbi:hypothetical protein [Myxococcus sp. SDU36]|uniref:hypothetical protein n=1 Tax=Myxococcus sp. SDU36 TaxID=2831967 RepID=UPI0025427126|nr:hypothetical protein [Myxococcus sp. SDU36]WIG93535.1 hypothetical protein KGD87_23460 [Myxococcus sp. SDU36]